MARGFDWIAPYYDSLARMVFGKAIHRCQLEYLDKIPPGSNVLILGGGTGWILNELFKANPTCKVWYVEASIKMLEKARTRRESLSPHVQISFIHGTERDLQQFADLRFDAVMANFYFDLFTTKSLSLVLRNIERHMNAGSKLLVSDFVESTFGQRLLLFVMYCFFRWTCAVEAAHLPDWQNELKRHGFSELTDKTFYDGFIKSALYVFDGASLVGS